VKRHADIWLLVIVLGLISLSGAARAQESAAGQVVGTWTGKWANSGGGEGGGFELTLEKVKETLTGRVSVTGEPTYKTAIKSIKQDGAKLDIRYDFPEDNRIEIVVLIAIEGTKATGTWAARESGGADVASGTLTLAKQ
jgi:hypothetical protein